jgi:pSer/pThr/pTyr-binding forkhead associated (FHA) protein
MDAPNLPVRAEPAMATPTHGALVLANGVRRPLTAPFAVVGRAPGCEVRLNAPAVNPLHCALVRVPGGLMLRDLQSEAGTLVNGERVTLCTVRDGDVVTVGPFEFRVHLPAADSDRLPLGAGALHEMELLQKEKEALRIQAAAVVAQQAALTDEENKLKQRETALQRQEEQLAAHLEAKRAQLAALQEQVGEARALLRRERAEFEERSKVLSADVERERAEAAMGQQTAARERARFIELRRRLKRRWRKHWSLQEVALCRRQQELEGEFCRLADEADRVQQEQSEQRAVRLRLNAEMELGRRQLQESRAELGCEQRGWAAQRSAEQAQLRKQSRALQQRESLLAEVERELNDDKQQWEGARTHLEQEIEGLESRARNLRQKLLEQQGASQSASPTPDSPPTLASTPGARPAPVRPDEAEQEHLEGLERLTGELADQRVQLAEQFARLVQAEQSWRQAHQDTIAELEMMALHLEEREDNIQSRERGLHVAEADLRQRREELTNGRCQLDAWRARLAARESAWESDRATLLAHVQASEELTKRQLAVLDDLRRKWKQRRREETTKFEKAHGQFIEARRLYATLWEECLRRSAAMDQEKRTLAEKTLALDQYRLQVIGQAENAAAAERQLERLRRRWAGLFTEAERTLNRERQAVEAEIGRLDTRFRQIEQEAVELAQREADHLTRQSEWENHQLVVDEANVRLRKELETLGSERAQQERQLLALRDEVERMAHTLLEQAEMQSRPTSQAA